jgi:hypothetical protein
MFGPWFLPTLLFVVLSPGVLVTLPPKGKPMVVLAVHAVIFAILFTVLRQYRVFEGFVDASGNVMNFADLALPKAGFKNQAGFVDMCPNGKPKVNGVCAQ